MLFLNKIIKRIEPAEKDHPAHRYINIGSRKLKDRNENMKSASLILTIVTLFASIILVPISNLSGLQAKGV